MSPFWPELLRITLSPDRVVLEPGKLNIRLKGVEVRYASPKIFPVTPCHDPALWAPPLEILGAALDSLPRQEYEASVILSNHFVRYPSANARLAASGPRGDETIDPALRKNLERVLEQRNCRLLALQPRVISLEIPTMDELHGEPGWLVVVEEGLACLGLIQEWEFIHLRNLHMWPASSVELLSVLDREASLAGLCQPPRNLTLWIRDESDQVILPANTDWHVIHLGGQPPDDVFPLTSLSQRPLAGSRA